MKPTFNAGFLILSLFLFGCDDNGKIDYYNIKPFVKEFNLFEKGSQWIYENDSSNILDTVTVTSSQVGYACYHIDNDDNCDENGHVSYYSSYKNSHFQDYLSGSSVQRSPAEFFPQPLFSNRSYDYDLRNYSYSYQYILIYTVKGTLYSDVVRIYMDNKQTYGTSDYKAMDYYWAPKIGIIKKIIYDGIHTTSWSLAHHNVSQDYTKKSK